MNQDERATTGGGAAVVVERALSVAGPVVVVAAVLYLARSTLMPGVAFWDTAEFQAVGPLMGTLHPTGFPAYTILGWVASVVLQPLGEPAFRMNVLSTMCVAASAGLTVVLIDQLTGRPAIAIAGGAILFLTQIAWSISTHADAHSLHLALLALILVLLVGWERRVGARDGSLPGADRWLVAAAAAYAVAVANHSLALLAAPGIAAFVLVVEPGIRDRRRLIGSCAGVFGVIVAVLYLELPLRAGPFRAPLVYGHPETLAGFIDLVTAGQFRGSLGTPLLDLGTKFHAFVDLTATQLGPLAALVPVGAVAAAVLRPRYVLLTAPTLAITCFFAMSYANADINRYYLGPLLIAITWIAILVAWIVDTVGAALGSAARRRAAGTVGIGAAVVLALDIAMAAVLVAPAVAAADATRRAVDLSGSTAAAGWLDRVLGELDPGAVVVSWWSYSTPLWYATEVEGRRRDITIIDDRTRLDEDLGDVNDVIDSYLGTRPVYVIRLPAELPALDLRYVLMPIPDGASSGLARVVARRPGLTP